MNENYSFIDKEKKKKRKKRKNKCADYASSASFYKKERKSLVFFQIMQNCSSTIYKNLTYVYWLM